MYSAIKRCCEIIMSSRTVNLLIIFERLHEEIKVEFSLGRL